MDKNNILRTLLNHGTQIDHDALDILAEDPNTLGYILEIGDNLPSVITTDFLKSLSITAGNQTQKTSVTQLSEILNYRYEFLRNVIINKQELANLISINKINEKLKHFSVIGVVSEKNGLLTIEDTTGQTTFTIDKELAKYIVEDEVIGLNCERYGGINKVNSVIYPDIPLKKENNTIKNKESCLFISDIHMDSPEFNITYYENFLNWLQKHKDLKIFVLGGVSSRIEDINKFLVDVYHPTHFYTENNIKSPSVIQIENLEILLAYDTFLQQYMELWSMQPNTTLINLIKKRNLNPTLTPNSYNNSFLLEKIPDIIVIGGVTKATSTNYKGMTLLTTGSFITEPIYWLIDLQTRETFKIDFS